MKPGHPNLRRPAVFVMAAAAFVATLKISAQQVSPPTTPWELQDSTTKAGLRGIHAVGNGVAWASGTNGTILRTEDGGHTWQSCAMPPGAEKLDFRGIWAWDANTAVAMSSGPGDLSRLYKTTDGCSSWKLLYTNPDKDGFWDAVVFSDKDKGAILGDPVQGRFVLLFTLNGGTSWNQVVSLGHDLDVGKSKIGAFAASNSSLAWSGRLDGAGLQFVTSGPDGPYVYTSDSQCTMGVVWDSPPGTCLKGFLKFDREKLPLAGNSASAGAFSFGAGSEVDCYVELSQGCQVVVGGDYAKPNKSEGTAAWKDADTVWTAAAKPPHGYRSAVAWDAADKAWVAVGTNGSDVSYDDGKTWQPLDNGKWNALSLPWAVGPEGRIAKLVSLKSAGISGK